MPQLDNLLPWTAVDAEPAEDAETQEVAETPSLAERVLAGEFTDAIDAALDRLVTSKPYLAPQPPITVRGIDQGPRGRLVDLGVPGGQGSVWLREAFYGRDPLDDYRPRISRDASGSL